MSARRTGVRVAVLGVLAVLGLQALGVSAARAASGESTADRTLKDSRIGESSGLVAGRRTPGVVWTHNDSGNSSLLYAVGRSGATTATARVSGVAGFDWEALAPLTGRDGTRLLAIGDIGDNEAVRSRIEIDVVAEPAATGSSRISPVRVIRARYPGGAADAEALLADPRDNRLYVVTKGLLSSTVYAVPSSAWPGGAGTGRTVTTTLQPIGTVNLTMVTDGAVLPDGRVLLRTYGSLAVLAPLKPPSGAATTSSATSSPTDLPRLDPLATMSLPGQRQGEGMAVLDAGAGTLLLSSEGVGSPILRLTVPPDVWRAGAAEAASAASSSPRSGASGGTGGPGSTSGGEGPTAGATSPGAAGVAGQGEAGRIVAGSGAWLITLAGGAAFVFLFLVARVLGRLRGHW